MADKFRKTFHDDDIFNCYAEHHGKPFEVKLEDRTILHAFEDEVLEAGDDETPAAATVEFKVGDPVTFYDPKKKITRHGVVHDVTRIRDKCIAVCRKKYYFVRENQAGELEGILQQR